MGTVANLAVKISANTQDFNAGMDKMAGEVQGISSTIGKMGGVATDAGHGLTGFLKPLQAIGPISAEQTARLDATFASIRAGGNDLKEAKPLIEEFGVGLVKGLATTAVLGGVAALTGLAYSAFSTASEISDLSKRLNISAEAVQRFESAANQGGSSIADVSSAITNLNKVLIVGGTSTVSALETFGLKLYDLQAMNPEQRFIAVAEAIRNMGSTSLYAKEGAALLGQSFLDLGPAIDAGIVEIGNQTRIMSTRVVADLAAAKQVWQEFGKIATVYSADVISALIGGGTGAGAMTGLVANMAGTTAAIHTMGKDTNLLRESTLALNPTLQQLGTTTGVLEAAHRKAAAAAEAHNRKIQALTDILSGKALQDKVNDLFEAFKRLTPAQLDTARVMNNVVEAAVNLQREGATLSPVLQRLVDNHYHFRNMLRDTAIEMNALNGPNLLPAMIANYKLLDAAYVAAASSWIDSVQGLKGGAGEIQQLAGQLTPPPLTKEWQEWKDNISGTFDSLVDNLGRTVLSLTGGWNDFWSSAKNTALQFMDDILGSLIHRFLDPMIEAIVGKQSWFGQAIEGLFGDGETWGKAGQKAGHSWVNGLTSSAATAGGGMATSVYSGGALGTEVALTSGTASGAAWGAAFTSAATVLAIAGAAYLVYRYNDEIKRGMMAAGNWLASPIGDLIFGSDPSPERETGIPQEEYERRYGTPGSEYQYGRDLGNPVGDSTDGGMWQGPVGGIDYGNYFASGTGGRYLDFGAGTPAMLHGSERVMTEAEGRSGGGNMTIILEQDGRKSAEFIAPYLPGVVKRYRLA